MSDTVEVERKETAWVSTDEAARLLRLTRRVFTQRWADGVIDCPRYRVEGERGYWFDPEDLREFSEDPGPEIADAPTAALLSQAYAHNELLIGQVLKLQTEVMTQLRAENEQLRTRCGALEQTHADLIEAREATLNEKAMRDAALAEAAASNARKDKALEKALEVGPKFINHWFASQQANAFLSSITTEQLAMLMGFAELDKSFLTPEQLKLIKQLYEERSKQEQSSKSESTEQQQSKESSDGVSTE